MAHVNGRGLAAALLVAFAAAAMTPVESKAQAANSEAPAPWLKICQNDPNNKKELCLVTQEVRAETGQFIAMAQLRKVTGEDKVSLVTSVPPGMLIEPGMRVQVDDGKEATVKYGVCFASACFGELEVDSAFIESLKKGSVLTLAAANAQGRVIKVPLTLSGFTKAYDGKGLDAAAAEQKQNDLNKALQQRAEEARKRLIEQQQKETGTN